jgi:YD repeat-containing protein
VANGSEVTVYTYDAWGRLRGIDYPRSADVRMGWDGENRRVWVRDGAGRREYSCDAWGRVVRQEGCCGDEAGIEVVAVAAEYDAAGRKRFERELRVDGSEVRTITYTYDPLGRLATIGDYRGRVVYTYETGTGRLQRENYPNRSYVEYTYYGAENPSQVGFVWKVEHKKESGELLIGYEYSYDLLGRVEKSVERRPDNPGTDTTVYTYTPAGRLESEVRTGQVAYSRFYKYNLDGRRAWVERDDALNGRHRDEYEYDPVSGRLQAVRDTVPNPPVVHRFGWNPEGTLARWEEPSVSYARVFGYDEEGRLVKIERDYGGGDVRLAYEYGYNSDGVRVWKRDVLNGQEYRYVCRIGCGGVPMRVYNRAMSGGSWASVEDYLETPTITGYSNYSSNFGDYRYLAGGRWLFSLSSTTGEFVYFDAFGTTPAINELRYIAPPLYLSQDNQSAFFPAAMKVIIVGGLVLIGISLCLLCTGNEPDPGGGGDAFLHCYFGCVGCSICGCPQGF